MRQLDQKFEDCFGTTSEMATPTRPTDPMDPGPDGAAKENDRQKA
jgi:hypothetical protein